MRPGSLPVKPRTPVLPCFILLLFLLSPFPQTLFCQVLYPLHLPDSLWHHEQRTLRYHPEGTDFVIRNGNRLFTRALYGTHTAFRVEAGDRPEFALYMPGMGGNLKLGLVRGRSSRWLTEASSIMARYRAGSMLYEITDSLLGKGKLFLQLLALEEGEGLVLRIRTAHCPAGLSLVAVFGGATGKKFSRDGDMGPDPPSNFSLHPENCKDNHYTFETNGFTLRYGDGVPSGGDVRYFSEDTVLAGRKVIAQTLRGTFPAGAVGKLVDARMSSLPRALYASSGDSFPAVASLFRVRNGEPYHLAIYNPEVSPPFSAAQVSYLFDAAEQSRERLAGRILIHTPDPFINPVGGALAVASDAIWEAPSYLHGAVGWRMRLNGWRGPYTGDPLGWHDRARMHLESYAQSQLTDPQAGPVIADTAMHLARSVEKVGAGMFTSGYISRDPLGKSLRAHHYDMNLVFIDMLLRHLAWTGDTAFGRRMWPLLQRHLAWEKRNFDPDGNGLYDAYAAIWASDALQYSGGSVTHSSAYNFYANKKAAELAAVIGEDPGPYRREADKIRGALQRTLWLSRTGTYAEFKDTLGNRLVHPSAAAWTVYHAMDSETMDPFQAYLGMRYLDNNLPHIPVRAAGLPDLGYYTMATTSWMPYTWSLNNVALAESMHTALANWQGGRTEEAFQLFKSEVLASMYLGGSPGNFVQISFYDAIRGEAYRDFGDPVGIFSRALVEGLFGIVPDALHGLLTIRPGLPAAWNYASFQTPDLRFDFRRSGRTDRYSITPAFRTAQKLRFQCKARGQVASVMVNGRPAHWQVAEPGVGQPVIELEVAPSPDYQIRITWSGALPQLPPREQTVIPHGFVKLRVPGLELVGIRDPQQALLLKEDLIKTGTAEVLAPEGSQTVFAQVKQGGLTWWMPLAFRVEAPVSLETAGKPGTFYLRNRTAGALRLGVQAGTARMAVSIPAGQRSSPLQLTTGELVPGTNRVMVTLPDGTFMTLKWTDWSAVVNKEQVLVDLTPFFNDPVTHIFKNRYLSPRPQVTTLQLPWQGTGDWPHPLESHAINDSGLRARAGISGEILLPGGIRFRTPGEAGAKNILFTSQWDNYPREATIPLTGRASHAWFLVAGSTNPMQSRLTNGMFRIRYTDGTSDSLKLRNPETWWPIEKDYYTDGFAFSLGSARPVRVHLKTGRIVSGDESLRRFNGKEIDGGAATVLDLPLDPSRTLGSLTLSAVANDVVIGLMSVTLLR